MNPDKLISFADLGGGCGISCLSVQLVLSSTALLSVVWRLGGIIPTWCIRLVDKGGSACNLHCMLLQ